MNTQMKDLIWNEDKASSIREDYQQWFKKLQNHRKSENITVTRKGKELDVSLVNFYRDHEFLSSFPDMWVDWETRLGSKVMIIGQDWGPFSEMQKVANQYQTESQDFTKESQEVWQDIMNNPPSRTSKFLINAIEESVGDEEIVLPADYMNYFFITMAVFFARQGEHFRGNHNFDDQISMELSAPLLHAQIELLKPKVIITLGGLALESLSNTYNFEIERTLTKTIQAYEIGKYPIKLKSGQQAQVIPTFHPAAHVSKEDKLNGFKDMWEALKNS